MQITIDIPDNLPQAFIHQEIQQLQEKLQLQSKITGQRVSKWKKMVQRIENKSFDLGDYTATFNQDRQEFTQSFDFK